MWMGQHVMPIWQVEQACRMSLAWFDAGGRQSPDHWSNDESYHWAEQVKARRQRRRLDWANTR